MAEETSKAVVIATPKAQEVLTIEGAVAEVVPGLRIDANKATMRQIKDHLATLPAYAGKTTKEIKVAAEDIMHNKLRPLIKAAVFDIIENYNLELPRYSKKINKITGRPQSGSVRFTSKATKAMTEAEVVELYRGAVNGDLDSTRRLEAAGIVVKFDTVEVRAEKI
jgi:hypothetical protein